MRLADAMKLPRREFLKKSATLTAAVAAAPAFSATAAGAASSREYYELRCYRLKADKRLKASAQQAPLDAYLEKAVLPALAKRGVKNVGVFTELEVDKKAGTSKPVAESPVWVLIPHANLDSFVTVSAELNADEAVQKAGASYLQAERAAPAFERVDSWLLLAFKGMPRMEIPAFSKNKTPNRVFEMRDYESHSELKALIKMAMFDEGEIELMRDLGMAPVFFGQALAGPNLPHLRYITSGPDLASHLAAWSKFGSDPRWVKMRSDPKWAGTVSLNTAKFLVPTPYSEI